MHSKLFKKICNIILDILIGIFGLILVITIYNDVQVKVFNKDYADFFGYTTFEVQTGSMAPAIKANDLVIVKIDNSPVIKDIITYKKGNAFITHRVIESYKETYVTKGDANNTKDEAIRKNQIVGKVVKIIPNFGTMRKTLLNPIVLLTLIATIFIISKLFSKKEFDFKKIIKKKETPKEEKKEEKEKIEEESTEPIAVSIEEEPKEETKKLKFQFVDMKDIDVEDDEEKTIYFRKISVDSSELNQEIPSFLEEEPEEPILIEEVNETEEEQKIETLRKKHKKFDTVIEKVVFIKEEELNEIINVLDKDKLKTNEATIKDKLLKTYIEGRYYNQYGSIAVDYNNKNVCSKLENIIKNESTKMIGKYKGNDNKYKNKVNKYQKLFLALINIEQTNILEEDIDAKASSYKKKIPKYLKYDNKELNSIIKDILRIQKMYKKIMTDTLESVDTNTFELHYNQLTTNKNMYGLVLGHNISFSKVYSSYIISKTYDEGVVAEDKVLVILNILLSKMANDMMNGNFKNKYILYLPITLYEKEQKLNHILKLLDDEFVKNSVLILVKSSIVKEKERTLQEIKKQGYQIAVAYDSVEPNDNTMYTLATYLFVDKKNKKSINLNLMNSNRIIFEDVLTKVDVSGGDE